MASVVLIILRMMFQTDLESVWLTLNHDQYQAYDRPPATLLTWLWDRQRAVNHSSTSWPHPPSSCSFLVFVFSGLSPHISITFMKLFRQTLWERHHLHNPINLATAAETPLPSAGRQGGERASAWVLNEARRRRRCFPSVWGTQCFLTPPDDEENQNHVLWL